LLLGRTIVVGAQQVVVLVIEAKHRRRERTREPSLRRSAWVKAGLLRLGAVSAAGVCESALFMMLFLVAIRSIGLQGR
jgi:hypothetical protein